MSRSKSIAFTPKKIGNLEIKNRLIKSATIENAASTSGEVTEALIDFYKPMAEGGIGLIITGAAGAHPKNTRMNHGIRAFDDKFLPGLKRLAKSVHDADSSCRIFLQLWHPGRQVPNEESQELLAPYMPPKTVEWIMSNPEIMTPEEIEGEHPKPTGPSAVYDTLLKQTPLELSIEDIEEIVENFAQSARRAQDAGFDGVQLHAAHGWLLSTFLSPHVNKRTDRYGGSVENRMRIVKEIHDKTRTLVGSDFPIIIKMNATDFFADGLSQDEAIAQAVAFSKLGFDALEVSGGMWEAMIMGEEKLGWKPALLPESRIDLNRPEDQGYFANEAKVIKEHVNIPIISVGGHRQFSAIEKMLKNEDADFIAIARPLIRQPDLASIWYNDGPDKARCISCNACFAIGTPPIACRIEE